MISGALSVSYDDSPVVEFFDFFGGATGEYDYTFKNLTVDVRFIPKVDYFLNRNFSVGFGLDYSQSYYEYKLEKVEGLEVIDFVYVTGAYSYSLLKSYAPLMEVAYHTNISDRFTFSNALYMSPEYIEVETEELPEGFNSFAEVDHSDFLQSVGDGKEVHFHKGGLDIETKKSKIKNIVAGYYPSVRYSFSRHIGVVARVGELRYVKKIKDTSTDSFAESNKLEFDFNLKSWRFGVFWNFGFSSKSDELGE